jgi:hypothetical protein
LGAFDCGAGAASGVRGFVLSLPTAFSSISVRFSTLAALATWRLSMVWPSAAVT